MKNILLISILLIMTCYGLNTYSQGIPSYPIPSYNVTVTSYANFFGETGLGYSGNQDGKQVIYVKIKSRDETIGCSATVWVYTTDHTTILGPYTINCGETLAVEVDDREWGVLIDSDSEIQVDVWFKEIE